MVRRTSRVAGGRDADARSGVRRHHTAWGYSRRSVGGRRGASAGPCATPADCQSADRSVDESRERFSVTLRAHCLTQNALSLRDRSGLVRSHDRRVPARRVRSTPRCVINSSSRDMRKLGLGQLISAHLHANILVPDLRHGMSSPVRPPRKGRLHLFRRAWGAVGSTLDIRALAGSRRQSNCRRAKSAKTPGAPLSSTNVPA